MFLTGSGTDSFGYKQTYLLK